MNKSEIKLKSDREPALIKSYDAVTAKTYNTK